ncbi:glycosyltransferase family 2 protein, partial [Candidatus Parcubacteria bacterium]|nr:glycosyltransferase family 2 protein [Candidatus Parcubacteria bacterium]
YFEDIDLCKRVKKIGYKLVIFKDISIAHLCGKSLSKNSKRKEYYYASQDYFYKKHYGLLKMKIIKLVRFPYKLLKNL